MKSSVKSKEEALSEVKHRQFPGLSVLIPDAPARTQGPESQVNAPNQ